jgi:hypothetical protein
MNNMQSVLDFARALNPAAKLYRHRMRGTQYVVLGSARLQSSTVRALTEHESTSFIAYMSLDSGTINFRPTEEFFDGRFEEVKFRPLEREHAKDGADNTGAHRPHPWG